MVFVFHSEKTDIHSDHKGMESDERELSDLLLIVTYESLVTRQITLSYYPLTTTPCLISFCVIL